jgi:hypothetical protein
LNPRMLHPRRPLPRAVSVDAADGSASSFA